MCRRSDQLTRDGYSQMLPSIGPPMASVPVCRVQLVREATLTTRAVIETAGDAADVLKEHLSGVDREHFAILMLDAKNHLLGIHTVSIGTLTSALISPREVFKAAILANAISIIIGHNHPSGDTCPSSEDVEITKLLRAVGHVIEIEVIDHIVISHLGNFTSFRESGGWAEMAPRPPL